MKVVRTAGPFDQDTLPAGLRRTHRIAEGTWGRLRVLEGSVRFTMADLDRVLMAGDEQDIPPGVDHQLHLIGPMRIEIDFLVS